MESTSTSEDPLPRIVPGVFFGAPVALPRGPQALPRVDVVAEQRERLMASITELVAAGGYAQVRIGALASRAKVSRTAFYACFPNKAACAFAAYDRFIEVLLDALAQGAGQASDMTELVDVLLDGYFSTLERDLVSTRAFLVEFDALGPPARERRRAALRGIAAYVRRTHEQFRGSDPTLAPVFAEEIYLGIVYIARQLACDALDEHPTPDLRAIGRTVSPWLLTTFRPGAPSAPAEARLDLRRSAE